MAFKCYICGSMYDKAEDAKPEISLKPCEHYICTLPAKYIKQYNRKKMISIRVAPGVFECVEVLC